MTCELGCPGYVERCEHRGELVVVRTTQERIDAEALRRDYPALFSACPDCGRPRTPRSSIVIMGPLRPYVGPLDERGSPDRCRSGYPSTNAYRGADVFEARNERQAEKAWSLAVERMEALAQ